MLGIIFGQSKNIIIPSPSIVLRWRFNITTTTTTIICKSGLKTSVSDIRKGDWIEYEGRVLVVNQINSSFSGRGARQFLVSLKDPIVDNFSTIKPSAKDFFEKLELQDVNFQFLYEADGMINLLNPKTLEEISVPSKLVSGSLLKVLEGGMEVKVRMNVDKPILVHSSTRNFKCTVSEVIERRDSKLKYKTFTMGVLGGDRKGSIVIIQGGAKVTCTTLLEVGDQILVGIDDLSYQGKAF